MNNLNYNIYTLNENLEDHEFIIQFNDSNNPSNFYGVQQIHNHQMISHVIEPWRPSVKLNKLHQTFQQTTLNQFPCLPCSNCGYLLYPDKAKWISYEEDILYPFKAAFPRSRLAFHPRPPARIAVCPTCKNKPNRMFPPYLHPIPPEIQEIPLTKRKYLSPIYLHSSLGRTPGSNPFNEYCSIVGTMNYSKNIRSFTLYSGMLGAFLESTENSNANHRWFHPTLVNGVNWLKNNNPYLRSYNLQLTNDEQFLNSPFPTATHLQEEEDVPMIRLGEIIVPNNDFDVEIHDEDANFNRLMAGFARTDNNLSLPISFNDPNLEALLFSDLFPDGKGTYQHLVSHQMIKLKHMENTLKNALVVKIQDLDYIIHGQHGLIYN